MSLLNRISHRRAVAQCLSLVDLLTRPNGSDEPHPVAAVPERGNTGSRARGKSRIDHDQRARVRIGDESTHGDDRGTQRLEQRNISRV